MATASPLALNPYSTVPAGKTMTVAQMRDYIDTHIDFYLHRRLKSTLGDGYTTIAEHRQALSAEQRDKVPHMHSNSLSASPFRL
ncbi:MULTISPECIES: hypothetical protein [unclassified Corynebacterium]|uniref:hypothetical protein n=1 Tax=unclassified Corynebacterium TaxID=2624378 RepID=UPI00114C94F5|nr:MULTISPECIES: hypothetical protein [unclassified Corynebacterium]